MVLEIDALGGCVSGQENAHRAEGGVILERSLDPLALFEVGATVQR